MVTIAHLVENIIRQKPFIQEALARGIVNNAALAEEMTPEIEKELGKKVKFSAVNMAIRRLAEKLDKSFVKKTDFTDESDVFLRSNLLEITLAKSEGASKHLPEIHKLIDLKKGDFLTITEGLYEIMIITNDKYEKKLGKIIPEPIVRSKIKNLSSVTIRIPEESVETLGLFYLVTRALNWDNINIIDIVSTFTEMTFIVREEDAARAYNTLTKLIREKS